MDGLLAGGWIEWTLYNITAREMGGKERKGKHRETHKQRIIWFLILTFFLGVIDVCDTIA
jgi:hypothetical protein